MASFFVYARIIFIKPKFYSRAAFNSSYIARACSTVISSKVHADSSRPYKLYSFEVNPSSNVLK